MHTKYIGKFIAYNNLIKEICLLRGPENKLLFHGVAAFLLVRLEAV